MTTPHKAMLIQAHDAPEPVAHIRQTYIVGPDGELLGVSEKKELRFGCGNDYAHCTPLYTHPPAVREPLTEAEIIELAKDAGLDTRTFARANTRVVVRHSNGSWVDITEDLGIFVRAIEAAHGIKS